MISKDNLKYLTDDKLIRIIGLISNFTPEGKIKHHYVSANGLVSDLIISYDKGDGSENKYHYSFNYMSPKKNSVTMNGYVTPLSDKSTADIYRILTSKTVKNPKTLVEIRNSMLEAIESGDMLEAKFLINSLDTYISKQQKKNKAINILVDIARKTRRKRSDVTKIVGKDSPDQD